MRISKLDRALANHRAEQLAETLLQQWSQEGGEIYSAGHKLNYLWHRNELVQLYPVNGELSFFMARKLYLDYYDPDREDICWQIGFKVFGARRGWLVGFPETVWDKSERNIFIRRAFVYGVALGRSCCANLDERKKTTNRNAMEIHANGQELQSDPREGNPNEANNQGDQV